MFISSIRMWGKFDRGMIVSARQGDLSISERGDVLGFSGTTVSEFAENGVKKNNPVSSSSAGRNSLLMREVGREGADWFKADRKVIEIQITTHYNRGMQKSIFEHTMHQIG